MNRCPLKTVALALIVVAQLRAEPQLSTILLTQIPANQQSLKQNDLPSGARLVRLDSGPDGWTRTVLSKGFAAAGRGTLSFDGRRILFVGRRGETDPTAVWEMNTDGSSPRWITQGPGDCRNAIYLSTIYTIDLDAPYYQIAFLAGSRKDGIGQLYTSKLDGSRLGQITFAPFGVTDPLILSDGRLLCSVWSPSQRSQALQSTWMTILVDGSELFPFAGQHSFEAIRTAPCETPGGKIVYAESELSSDKWGGQLVSVERTNSLASRSTVTDDRKSVFATPSALPDGRLLLAFRSLIGPETDSTFGVGVLSPHRDNQVSNLFDDKQWHDIHPVAMISRKEPQGRSSVIRRKAADDSQGHQKSAHMFGLDVYLSNLPETARIQRGEVKNLRIVQLKGTARVGDWSEHVLGDAPVEPDGSFFVEVPAQVPLRVETLGRNGQSLQKMKSWFWLMPGERRGCIGCHEDRELTPPNRHVEALRKKPHRIGLEALRDTGHQE